MKRARILLVDDDRGIRQMYRTALTLAGFQVDTAEDGVGALRRIDEQAPDLVVLDLHLPQLDGLSVLSELRANSETHGMPVVVITGTEQSVADPATTLLKKPFDPEELICAIQHRLHHAA